MRTSAPVFFDFAEFGVPGVWPIDPEFLGVFVRTAEHMQQTYSSQALQTVCEYMTECLQQEIQEQSEPDQEWMNRAILVTAIRGVVGVQTPPIVT